MVGDNRKRVREGRQQESWDGSDVVEGKAQRSCSEGKWSAQENVLKDVLEVVLEDGIEGMLEIAFKDALDSVSGGLL